jgi:hypothetical protein
VISSPGLIGYDDPDYGVATGCWMVVQEDHRLPVGRDLDTAQDHPLARQLLVPAPADRLALEAQPDAVGLAAHDVRRAGECLHRIGLEPVLARTEPQPQLAGRPWCAHRLDRNGRMLRLSDRQHVALGHRLGSEPGQQVGRPRSQDGLDIDTTRDGQVGPEPLGHRTQFHQRPRRHRHGVAPLLPTAPDGDRDAGTGDRNRGRRAGAEGQLPAEALQGRRRLVVADQPVGQPVRRGVESAGVRDAEVGMPRAPQVLDGDLGADVPDLQLAVSHR